MMNILLINPPNCGRSIPEERYGITSLKQIFRGEPLALEELAGNLLEHAVRILDLKAASAIPGSRGIGPSMAVAASAISDSSDIKPSMAVPASVISDSSDIKSSMAVPASVISDSSDTQPSVAVADLDGLERELREFQPDLVGITGVTCEANTVLRIAARVKESCPATVVVGGIHASNDPAFFNHSVVDYIVVGIGKKVFADLVRTLESNKVTDLPGVIRTSPGRVLERPLLRNRVDDLVMERPPAYGLVSHYRSHYILEKLGITMGFVASAYGCPHRCLFCSIQGQTGGGYLTKSIETVIRDISLLPDIPVIRLVDANTFGDVNRATALGHALLASGLNKQYLADIRSDTVVRHPEMLRQWKEAGLRAVIIGFEGIDDASLSAMNKANHASMNAEAIAILNDLGITIVGDFIISPDYDEHDFDRLGSYLGGRRIDLPMITVMTPLPGTALYRQERHRISNHNLDYYTLTNAVTPTKLDEQRFYSRYAELLANSHHNARL